MMKSNFARLSSSNNVTAPVWMLTTSIEFHQVKGVQSTTKMTNTLASRRSETQPAPMQKNFLIDSLSYHYKRVMFKHVKVVGCS
jgi:hypothetical protein